MRGTGILLDGNFDLKVNVKKDAAGKIVSGVEVGQTLFQNQAVILLMQPGELKMNPVMGVGFENVILDTDYAGWRQRIRKQMQLDGQKNTVVYFGNNQNLAIDGGYQ